MIELSMAEIALIQIACRAMMENDLHRKDRMAYESLLGRLAVIIKGKKMSVNFEGVDKLKIQVPAHCMNIGGRGNE